MKNGYVRGTVLPLIGLILVAGTTWIGAAYVVAAGNSTSLWWRSPLAVVLSVIAIYTIGVTYAFWNGNADRTVRDIVRSSLKG